MNQLDLTKILQEDFGIAKEELLGAFAHFYDKPAVDLAGRAMPADLKDRLSPEFLKKNLCAPIEKKEGTLTVAVEDPQDLTRLDAIKAMNVAPRHEFVVALRTDIVDYINATYGLTPTSGEEQDLGRIITQLGSGDEDELEAEQAAPEAEIDETDSGIIKLANQIIIDAYRRGASDIHIEPNGKDGAHPWCASASTATASKYQEIPAPYRNAVVRALKIMARLDISERRKPQDGKIRFRVPDRQIELRVATIPTVERQRGRGHAHPGRLQAAAAREDGHLRAQPRRAQEGRCRSRTASACASARPARARPRRCTRRSATSTPST